VKANGAGPPHRRRASATAPARQNHRPTTLDELDQLDRRIIDALQTDGRRSNTAIARTLGVTETTVRYRIERLISDGFIRITAVVDPRKTAYKVDAVIWFRVKPGRALSIGERLARYPNIAYVSHLAGRYDLVAEALFAIHARMNPRLVAQKLKVLTA